MAARLRARVGLDDAIGGALAAVAVVLDAADRHPRRAPARLRTDRRDHAHGVRAGRRLRTGSRPQVGRDRAFVASRTARSARRAHPPPDKVGSAPLPIGSFGEVKQAEAIQPPSVLLRRRAGDVVRVRARQGGRAAAVRRLPLPVRGRDHLPRRLRHRRDRARRGHRDAPVCQRKRPDGRLELRDERDDDAPPGRSCDLAERAGDSRPAADVAAHIRRRRARDHAHHRRAAGRALPAGARGRPDTRAGTGRAARRREAGARRGDPARPVGALESRALPLGRAPGARRQRHRRTRLGHDRQRQRVRVHGAVLPLVHHEHPGPLPPPGDQSLRLRLAAARVVRAAHAHRPRVRAAARNRAPATGDRALAGRDRRPPTSRSSRCSTSRSS